MNNLSKNVCDIPLQGIEDNEDKMKMSKYIEGLVNFINHCDTPMTISLQGEWGSGKTSLINNLYNRLDSNKFEKNIINTWDYALIDRENISMTIMKDFLKKIDSTDEKKEVWGIVGNFMKTGAQVGAKILASKVSGGGADISDDLKDFINLPSLSDLKMQIKELIQRRYESNGNKSFIFFIDDLDRLNPPDAIRILELLKNLFDQPNCIFVLALDYDVVVKGLKAKFGDDEKNEREYRQFFDKIVQLPFSMPINNYKLDEFLENLLVNQISFFEDKTEFNDYSKYLIPFTINTIGKNPRALKRIANYLSLIKSIIEADENNSEEKIREDKIVQYALLCIQVAYPEVFSLLSQNPNFKSWGISDYTPEMFDIKTNEEIFKDDEYLNDIWEQTLYKYVISMNNKYLIDRVKNISITLNKLSDFFEEERGDEESEKILEEMIKLSSITNASSQSAIVESNNDFSSQWKDLNQLLKEFGKFNINKKRSSQFTFKNNKKILNKPNVVFIDDDSFTIEFEYLKTAGSNMYKQFIKDMSNLYSGEIENNQKKFTIEVNTQSDLEKLIQKLNALGEK